MIESALIPSGPLERTFRRALSPPEQLTIAPWAERHIELPARITNFPGPYRATLTAYIAAPGGLFDVFQDPAVRTIYLCFGAQTAKTTGMLICLLYAADQDPGPALWAMPTETLARSFSDTRLQPLIDDNPRLARHKPADLDKYKKLEMQLRRMTLSLVGGNSPANLSSRPIRYLFADEVDKFPIETRREGSALNLARKRTATFWNSKEIISSTPSLTTGQIWRGLLSGDWRQYWVPCPRCGEYQILAFARIRKPDKLTDPEEIADAAWYQCEHCGARIANADKPEMVEAGHWRPRADPVRDYEWAPPPPGGETVSLHLPDWYSPWVSFGQVLSQFFLVKREPPLLRVFINSSMAEPWEERGEVKSEDEVLAHCSAYSPGTIPESARVLAVVQTVDVQPDCLYYTVRAWGLFEESWLLAYGVLPDFSALGAMLGRDYSGRMLRLLLIDSKFRTAEVYTFCRDHPGCLPYRGERRNPQPVRWSSIDRLPDGTQLRASLKLVLVDGHYFKGMLFHRLGIAEGEPGYWHLHAEAGEDYARQIVSEVLVQEVDAKGRASEYWKQTRRDNHYLDCEVEQLAASHILGVRYVTEKEMERAAGPPAPPAPKAKQGEPKSGKASLWKATRLKI